MFFPQITLHNWNVKTIELVRSKNFFSVPSKSSFVNHEMTMTMSFAWIILMYTSILLSSTVNDYLRFTLQLFVVDMWYFDRINRKINLQNLLNY